MIAQWVDENWILQVQVIDLLLLEGGHTGQRMADAFLKILDDFEITHKINAVTADNASNMNSFADALEKSLKLRVNSLTIWKCS